VFIQKKGINVKTSIMLYHLYGTDTNQNHIKIPPHLWLPSRTQTTANAGKDVGEKELSYTAGGNVK
jgi:hypothetical protein